MCSGALPVAPGVQDDAAVGEAALVAGLADRSIVLDTGCDWQSARTQLLALPGVGPWTARP
ncbi:hypothetical protein MAHJHV50_50750 [Mycobacterium avium subsp. hominissuis]